MYNLAYLDDGASVKKIQFIQCYNNARNETFASRVIRAGWQAAGLCPWNPRKIFESDKVRVEVVTPSISSTSSEFPTPTKPSQVTSQMQSVLDELLSTPPDAFVSIALIAKKAGHAVSRLSAKLARYEAEILR